MPKKILVVDDEAEVREYLKRVLEQKGYAVGLAEGGEKALKRIREETFDLVLLDLIMPDFDGFQVLRTIRSSNNILPVIILTAYGTDERLKEAVSLGATSFIGKGVGIAELINKIEGCLSLSPQTEEREIDILVIEDESSVSAYLKDVLEEEGYSVKVVIRGEDAIPLVIKNRPRLILLDIMLSGIDGVETLRQIRKIDREVIVFFLSAHLDTLREVDKYNLNVYAELNKPVGGSELKRYIREALSFASTQGQNEKNF